MLWIVGGGADELLAPSLEDLPAFPMEHTCPTASSEPSPMEATSQSITGDGNPMAERQEYTSASDSADAMQPKPNSHPSSPQGATNPGGTILEAVAPDPPALPNSARPVVVAAMGSNGALPVVPEPDDDHEPGQLVIAQARSRHGPDASGVNK